MCVCVFLVKVARSKTYWNAAVLIIAIVGIVSRSLNCIHITEVTFGGVLVANDFKRFNEPLWNNQFKQLKVDKKLTKKARPRMCALPMVIMSSSLTSIS